MKASDTVLSKQEIKQALIEAGRPKALIDRILEALVLWWKAGWIQEILLVQKQAGIKEVVEWIESNTIFGFIADHKDYIKYRSKWKSKLKEWGIE